MREVDVAIVGAGVAGCCVARECARFALKVAVFEAGLDVADGATRANSGIVHAGYDPKPGTRKARFNVEGAKLYPQWASELGFPYVNNGSMVLAFTEEELEAIRGLRERGEHNGVEGLRVIDARELRELEPNVSPEALGALLVPTGAICDPYQVAFRAAENAARNGVEFNFSSKVVGIEPAQAPTADSAQAVATGSIQSAVVDPARGAGFILHIEGAQGDVAEAVHARVVVNAAGVHADEIHDMVAPHAFSITPRRGEYNLMDTDMGGLFAHTMFQAPTKAGTATCSLVRMPFPKATKMPRQLLPRAWPQSRPPRKRRTPRLTCEPALPRSPACAPRAIRAILKLARCRVRQAFSISRALNRRA